MLGDSGVQGASHMSIEVKGQVGQECQESQILGE